MLRSSAWLLLLVSSPLYGCSDDVTTASSQSASSSTGEPACTDTHGTLAGSVYDGAPPGEPNSSPAPKALIHLSQMVGETPLTAMADDQGHYEVPLEAGDWMVGGDDGTGCKTTKDVSAHLEACQTTTVDLVLDVCVD